MKVCGVCGKRIAVMWPEFWVYKHGKGEDTTYYCSENCMIVADTREMKDRIGWVDPQAEMTEEEIEAVTHGRPVGFRRLRKTARREEQPAAPAGQERTGQEMGNSRNAKKLTREEKEKAVELAIDGKDPIGYLKECGCKNPWASWAYIKNVLKKSKPELYAKIPSDDDRLDEEVSYGAQAAQVKEQALPEKFEGGLTAQVADEEAEWTALPAAGNQTAAAGGDPSTAPDGSAQDDKLVIRAEDIAAALDPAVERMEQIATMEPKLEAPRDRVKRIVDDLFRFSENVTAEQNPAGRVVLDKSGVHTVQEKPEKPKDPEQDKVQEDATGFRPEVMTFYGFPCEVTALKIDDFEFAKDREGMRAVLPGGTILWGDTVSVPVIMAAEQWKKLAEIIPKVMKILRIE